MNLSRYFLPRALSTAILASAFGPLGCQPTQADGDPFSTEDTADLRDIADYPPEVTDVLDLPVPAYAYQVTWPDHFDPRFVAAVDNTPADNPTTVLGATLGRVLFYDVRLSANHTVSCASCHLQANGFSDPVAASEGFDGGLTGRNSMGLANSALYRNGHAFWDERAASLEEQALGPIQDPVEMGLTLGELEDRVSAAAYYPRLFADAFGDEAVTAERIGLAIAQFVRSITSTNTRFDDGMVLTGSANLPFPNFTAQENEGKALFFSPQGDCAVCHVAGREPGPGGPDDNQAIFFMDRARHNGLDATTTDAGLGEVTGDPRDDGKFKSPSLRNIAVTAPYMHDGRFDTLEEVIDHYDSGVQDHPNLDPRLIRNGAPQRLGLTSAQKDALVAFLETLTDDVMANDPRWSDPFLE